MSLDPHLAAHKLSKQRSGKESSQFYSGSGILRRCCVIKGYWKGFLQRGEKRASRVARRLEDPKVFLLKGTCLPFLFELPSSWPPRASSCSSLSKHHFCKVHLTVIDVLCISQWGDQTVRTVSCSDVTWSSPCYGFYRFIERLFNSEHHNHLGVASL